MGISALYNQTVDIERLENSETSSYKMEYATHLENVAVSMQPLDPTFSEDIPGGFGKDKLMICGLIDIKEGDRVIHGSDQYRVVGVESYLTNLGTQHHLEVVIRIWK